MAGERRVPRAAWLLALLLAAGAGCGRTAETLPNGPQPIAWGHATCARCGMVIREPAFAAQLQTKSGEVLDFDDPGCLLLYVLEHHPDVHALWFHHQYRDQWIPGDNVVFYPAHPTPMSYGFGARTKQEGAGLSLDAATEQARLRDVARKPH